MLAQDVARFVLLPLALHLRLELPQLRDLLERQGDQRPRPWQVRVCVGLGLGLGFGFGLGPGVDVGLEGFGATVTGPGLEVAGRSRGLGGRGR